MSKTYSPLVSLLKKRFYFGFTHKKLFLLNKDFFCWKKKNVLLKIKFFWVGGFTCGNTNVLLVLFMENKFSLIKKKKKFFCRKKVFLFSHMEKLTFTWFQFDFTHDKENKFWKRVFSSVSHTNSFHLKKNQKYFLWKTIISLGVTHRK